MKIGTFSYNADDKLQGAIQGLGMGSTVVVFEPEVSKDGKVYHRLIAEPQLGAYEIGVAFPKDKDGKAYHSVSIDSPALPAPINAALFQDKNDPGAFSLVWNRPAEQAPNANAKLKASAQNSKRTSTALHPAP